MNLRDRVREHRQQLIAIVVAHGGSQPRLFGSVARGDDTPESDVDLLVSVQPGTTLFDLARMEVHLEELFGRTFDVVPDTGLGEPFVATVTRDVVDV